MRRILLFFGCIIFFSGCHHIKPKASSETIRVMTFNIRYGTAKDGDNRWELRAPLLMECIRQQQPDFLATQEALNFQAQAIGKAFPQWASIGLGRYFNKEMPDRPQESMDGESCRIFYPTQRFELLKEGTFWHSDQPEVPASISWGNSLPRITTWGLFRSRTTGKELVFMNTHFHGGEPYVSRTSQLMVNKWHEIAGDRPTLLTGDFNLPPTSDTHKLLCGNGTTSSGLRFFIDAWQALAKSEIDAGTGHGFKGVRSEKRIDWILCSQEFQVKEVQIVYFNQDGRYPSDHYPVVAALRY